MSSSDNIIEFVDVHKHFQTQDQVVKALEGVSFTVKRGSFTILYGASGSGKSTILNALMGLQLPTKGKVIINGQDLYQLNSDKRARFRSETIGSVYQAMYWIKSLSVLDNVATPLYLAGWSRNEARQRAMQKLTELGMEQYANTRPTVLSGGQQQRISMARALITDPQLLIADEPTGNLDSKNGGLVMDMLKRLNATTQCTVVLVTHNLEYLPLSSQQLFIKDGVLQDKDPDRPRGQHHV